MEFLSADALSALLQVIAIDLVLAGDNAIIIGLAAAGLPREQRGKAIAIGIVAATVLRIIFALLTVQLLKLGPALLIAGGLLLLWVCWKMWRELRAQHEERVAVDTLGEDSPHIEAPRKTLRQAATQIIIADVSMSLDNVLAVAGAAMHHPWVLVFGLALSILLMGVAATFIAKLLHRFRWIAYIGLLVILYVAGTMVWHGWVDFWPTMAGWFGMDVPLPDPAVAH